MRNWHLNTGLSLFYRQFPFSINWQQKQHSFSAGTFFQWQVCILWLNGALLLSHNWCNDSLNPHKWKLQNYLFCKFRICDSKITNFLRKLPIWVNLANYIFSFRFVSQIIVSPLRDNNKTTTIFRNDSREHEIAFQFLKQSKLTSVC